MSAEGIYQSDRETDREFWEPYFQTETLWDAPVSGAISCRFVADLGNLMKNSAPL